MALLSLYFLYSSFLSDDFVFSFAPLVTVVRASDSLSLTGSASRTDLSQLANGIWEIHAGCPSFLRVSSVAKIGYIPQFKASNAIDQDEVSSDLARMPATKFKFPPGTLPLHIPSRSIIISDHHLRCGVGGLS